MAMFECPGCKSIVDDSIKKCPKCGYDIKKYVKSMGKTKKGGAKADESVSFNLASAYSAKQPATNVPTLDFLSKPVAPIAPVEEVKAPAPAMVQTPMPAAPAPAEPVAPAPSVPEPAASEEVVSHFTDYSSVEISSVSSAKSSTDNDIYNDPSYIAPIAPASVPAPQAYTASGTVQMPSYDVSGVETVQISAPSKAAPERRPVTPNGPIVPPSPVYEDTVQPTVTLAPNTPAPVQESSTPVVTVSDAGYAKLNQQPEVMPVFDSPSLNAAQANNVRQAQPASAATLTNQQLNSTTFGYSAVASKQAEAVPAYRSANVNNISPSGMPTTPAQPEVQGIFESPVLNAQAKKIASGEYVPTSVASQASISAMQQRKVAPPPPGMGISRQVFGQAGYTQNTGYRGPSQPLVYQEQAPVGVQPQYQSAPRYQTGTPGVGGPVVGAPNPVLGTAQAPVAQQNYSQAPTYGSFNGMNGSNGSNVNIPTNGSTGPGAANPLLVGNPLLVNRQ